ncbi:UDP-N-acetylglucosamine 2-epimerase [Hyphomicrobium sp.]|uniref:UDP-N-acetylglucosamine 2-epimerase n=1 Tax=Hyphomicrobium sp. TaxID=82 RepID=UPI003F730AEF
MPLDSLRRVVVVTTSRADFGIYQPAIAALRESASLRPALLVSGNHVPVELQSAQRHQAATELAQAAGVPISAVVPMPLGEGSAQDIARAMGVVTADAAQALVADRPDILLVLGDRYEMHAVVVAASALRIPVAHIHGGEESEGAIDNLYRHSITKLSHLHFCSTDLSRSRILAMGEEPWRVHVSGAPALDGLADLVLDERASLLKRLDIPDAPFFMSTFHPETVDVESSLPGFEALIAALDENGMTTVFSRANADEAGQQINERLEAYAQTKAWLKIRDNLGRQGYFSAMRHAELMVGNSSSGILEAASFGLPVVNVGRRQAGRERSANTIDTEAQAADISRAIESALSPSFRANARAMHNVYKRDNASSTIRAVLENVALDRSLITKRFHMRDQGA